MKKYIVRKGDCLSSIAFRNGTLWQKLWDLPENRKLKDLRKDPNVIWPGDIVMIPELETKQVPAATEEKHSYTVKSVKGKLRLRLIQNDKPLANIPVKLNIDGSWFELNTDGDGWLEQVIKPDAKQGKLLLNAGKEEIRLCLGGLDPVEMVKGVQQRLANLGFYATSITSQLDGYTQISIMAFQRYSGLSVDGAMNEALYDALKKAHGS